MRNIYESTDRMNDSTPYNDCCNSGYSGNYEHNFENAFGRSLPVDYMGLSYRLDRMEEMIQGMYKERKKKKGKHKDANKKLKKRLKAVEMRNEYIAECLVTAMAQTRNADRYAWLKKSVENSAPQLVELLSSVVTSKRQPAKIPGQPLCLPDKSRIK